MPQMTRKPWDWYAKEALTDVGMPAKWRIVFHCFNPNGLYAELKVMHQRISDWCHEHPECPNGVILVHGSLNDHPRELLFDALKAPLRRKNVTRDINVAISTVRHAIHDGNEWLDDPSRWPKPRHGDR